MKPSDEIELTLHAGEPSIADRTPVYVQQFLCKPALKPCSETQRVPTRFDPGTDGVNQFPTGLLADRTPVDVGEEVPNRGESSLEIRDSVNEAADDAVATFQEGEEVIDRESRGDNCCTERREHGEQQAAGRSQRLHVR